MLKIRTIIVVMTVFLALTACGMPPIMSIPKLMKIDPFTSDFSQAFLILRLPNQVRPDVAGLAIQIKADFDNNDPSVEALLYPSTNVPDSVVQEARKHIRPGENIYAFGFAPQGLAQARQVQQQVALAKSKGITGSFHINPQGEPEGMCLLAPMPNNARYSAWLMTSETGEFVHLQDNQRFSDLFKQHREQTGQDPDIKRCTG